MRKGIMTLTGFMTGGGVNVPPPNPPIIPPPPPPVNPTQQTVGMAATIATQTVFGPTVTRSSGTQTLTLPFVTNVPTALSPSVVGGVPFTSDFTGANGAAWPGWTTFAGTVDIQSNKGRQLTAASNLAVAGAYYNTALAFQNYELTVDGTPTTVTSTDYYGALNVRGGGITHTDMMMNSSWHLRFVGLTGSGWIEAYNVSGAGAQTYLGGGPDIDFVQGSVIHVKVRVEGQNLKLWYYKDAETISTDPQFETTDGAAPTGNRVSLAIRNGSNAVADDWRWDNFSITEITTTTPINPSGQVPPGAVAGWNLLFVEDFNTDSAVGTWGPTGNQVPAAYASHFSVYDEGWNDTSSSIGENSTSRYSPLTVLSTTNGCLQWHLYNSGSGARSAAVRVAGDQLSGRVAMRFRAEAVDGFKTAWLWWPADDDWPRNGEIDFPEGSLQGGTIQGYMHRQNATSGGDQAFGDSGLNYQSWHTAVCEWEAGVRCKFILDGVTILNETNRVPNTPMHFVLQTESDLGSNQPPNGTSGFMFLDWIVYYSKA